MIAVIALPLAACGATKQYMIPRGVDGSLFVQPKAKLRFSGCANCYMWQRESASPRSYIQIKETPRVSVALLSPHRCFLWILFVPLPRWGSCSSTVDVPESHVIFLRFANNTGEMITLSAAPMLLKKFGRTLLAFAIPEEQRRLDTGEPTIVKIDVGPWSKVGWGYTIDLSGPLDSKIEPVSVERFTSTTFGLMLLD